MPREPTDRLSGKPEAEARMVGESTINGRLIGAWELREWSESRSDGGKSYPLGEDAIGQLLYTADGLVAAQLVRINRQKFASDDWRRASPEEAARAFKEYFGYFGVYEIDLQRQTVVHHVKG